MENLPAGLAKSQAGEIFSRPAVAGKVKSRTGPRLLVLDFSREAWNGPGRNQRGAREPGMIRVIAYIIPKGDESKSRELGRIEIANIGKADADIGIYEARLFGEYTPAAGRLGFVYNFHRRKQSVWSLVGALLKLWGHTKHSPKQMKKA